MTFARRGLESLWLLALAAVLPVALVAAALLFYVHVKCKLLADAMILLAIPSVAGSVFFAGCRVFASFQRGRTRRAVLTAVVYLSSFALSSIGVIRLGLAGLSR